jgi:uncharacterized protein YdhG (YjbR/CyaY superfamily)
MAMTMKSAPASDVNEYINAFPREIQKIMKQLRSVILEEVPDAEQSISYGIPQFSRNGSYVVYFGGFKSHLSLFPAPRGNEKFAKALEAYKGGKGTAQFPYDKPLPITLIRRIVKFQLVENAKRTELKKERRKIKAT